MFVSAFFNSYQGMYLAQSFCHSVITALITHRAIKSWKIHDPAVRQRFHFLVILFPLFSFPAYQLIDPSRSSPQFRLEALFDVNRWLVLEVWGITPFALLFLVLIGSTALVFVFQEMIPVLKHTFRSGSAVCKGRRLDRSPFLEKACEALFLSPPEVIILDDDDPVLFSTTGKQAVIYISSALERELKPDQLQAALAHELAHIARNRRPLLMAMFVLRIIMFFNPVTLVKFRHAVRNEEKICDDIAVSLTGNPAALAGALEKFYEKQPEIPAGDRQKLLAFTNSLEEQSHNLHLESRIKRLKGPVRPESGAIPLAAALLASIVLNYFIV